MNTLVTTDNAVILIELNGTGANGLVLVANGSTVKGLLTDANGNLRYAMTNPFGFCSFADVSTGETYVLTAMHKRFEFAAQIVSVTEERDDINFTASPRSPVSIGF